MTTCNLIAIEYLISQHLVEECTQSGMVSSCKTCIWVHSILCQEIFNFGTFWHAFFDLARKASFVWSYEKSVAKVGLIFFVAHSFSGLGKFHHIIIAGAWWCPMKLVMSCLLSKSSVRMYWQVDKIVGDVQESFFNLFFSLYGWLSKWFLVIRVVSLTDLDWVLQFQVTANLVVKSQKIILLIIEI